MSNCFKTLSVCCGARKPYLQLLKILLITYIFVLFSTAQQEMTATSNRPVTEHSSDDVSSQRHVIGSELSNTLERLIQKKVKSETIEQQKSAALPELESRRATFGGVIQPGSPVKPLKPLKSIENIAQQQKIQRSIQDQAKLESELIGDQYVLDQLGSGS